MRHIIILNLILSFLKLNAQSTTNQTDERGLKQGFWIKRNPETRAIIYKGQFKDNKPFGIFKYYYQEIDTIKSIIEFRDGGNIAYSQLFHSNGKKQALGKYVNEKKDSTWTFYNEQGKLLSIENYSIGTRNGKSIVYYPGGSILEDSNFKNDKRDGVHKEYYENKQLKSEANYVNGKLVGKNAFYYPNGMLSNIGYYNESGNKFGVWLSKDEEGKVTAREVYENGTLLEGKAAEAWLERNKAKNQNTEKQEQKKNQEQTPIEITPPKKK